MVIGGLAVVLIAGLALATHYRLTNARMPRKHVHAQVPSNIAFEESEEEEEVLENVRIDTIPSATDNTQQLKPIKPAMISTVPLSFSEKPMVHTGFGDVQPGSMMGGVQSSQQSATMGSISAMGSLTGDVTMGGMPIGGSFNPSEMHMLQH